MKSYLVIVVVVVVAAAALACGDDGGSAVDASTTPDACDGPTGCGEVCERGNSYGVGHYCTEGGGECSGQIAPFCTLDFNPTDLAFCTRPCDPEGDVVEQCGEDAECRDEGGSGPSGCFPIICN